MSVTVTMPMMMPSVVSTDRSLFARMALHEISRPSRSSVKKFIGTKFSETDFAPETPEPWRRLAVCRVADWQSAGRRIADCQSAKQQVANLRYKRVVAENGNCCLGKFHDGLKLIFSPTHRSRSNRRGCG